MNKTEDREERFFMIKCEKSINLFRGGQKAAKALFSALFLACLIFTSCDNFTGGAVRIDPAGSNNSTTDDSSPAVKTGYVTVSGSIDVSGAMPEEIALAVQNTNAAGKEEASRTAFPSIPAAGDLTYDISARIGNTVYASGKINADGKSYSIGIPATDTEKNYTIHVDAIYDEKIILSGESQSFSVSLAEPLVEVPAFKLSVDKTSSLPGNVKLDIDVSGTEINKLVATFPNSSEMSFTVSSDNNSIAFTGLVTKAAHSIKFSFYDASNILLYSFTEIINVFSNMTTDTWVQNGNEPWFVTTTDASGKKTTVCRITSAMVDGFKLTQIYVDPSCTTDNPSAASYTSQSGTFINPKVTFNDAIAMLNDAGKDYTIYIKGELRGAQTIPDSIQAKSLTIRGATGLDASGLPQDGIKGYADELVGHEYDFSQITNYAALNDAGKIGSALTVSTAVPVTLENIKLFNSAASGGGGLRIGDGSEVTLKNGVLITGNKTRGSAGGVYVDGGTLVMTGGKISGNSSFNTAGGYGGGVFVASGGSFTMRNGEISCNRASNIGGGVATSSASFTLEGGKISDNICDGQNDEGHNFGNGGGVCADYSFTMTGGEISGNSSNDEAGGVFMNGGDFIMTGGKIENNESEGLCGGVYIASTGILKMGGSAFIPNNTAGSHTIFGKINIISTLTPPPAATDGEGNTTVATIKPGAVTGGSALITAEAGVTLNNEIPKFKMSGTEWELYEDGKVGQLVFYVSETGHDTFAGTDEKSLASFTKAISNIKSQYTSLNRKLALTIVVKGDVESLNTTFDFDTDTAESILLRGYNDSPTVVNNAGTIEGITDKMNAKGSNTVLTINTDVPVTIRNILITGAYGVDHHGIYMRKGELTLETGACISGNTAHVPNTGGWGGGIYQEGGVITMKSGAYITKNLADGMGGGVAVRGNGKFILDGGEISYNAQELHTGGGGGVYVHHGSSFICNSGCIKNNRLNITDGDVTGSGVLLQYGSTSCTFASGNPADYIFDNSPGNCQLNSRGY